jgi:glucosamine--fructose-6-phosphate aminotransferase (isomerizing)
MNDAAEFPVSKSNSTQIDMAPSPYAHWMLKEIYEQPEVLAETLEQYVDASGFRNDTCAALRQWLTESKNEIVIAASGSSRHAGMAAEIMIEEISGIAVDVEYASEYCCRSEVATKQAAVIVISQSGETADTLAALRKAHRAGSQTLAITNVVDSSMAREASVSFSTEAGCERAIPATKSFTGQLLNLYLLSLLAAESTGAISSAALKPLLIELASLPARIRMQLLEWERTVRIVAQSYHEMKNFLFLGRGIHYPIAREGALKLKESAYLHAEGYPSGELKHGPNALVNSETPLVMIATVDHADADSVHRYEKTVQLLRDMRHQGAQILAIANSGDNIVAALADHTIFIDAMREPLLAMCEVVPLQLLSYYMAIQNGIDVDNPRNLTKAVLTE